MDNWTIAKDFNGCRFTIDHSHDFTDPDQAVSLSETKVVEELTRQGRLLVLMEREPLSQKGKKGTTGWAWQKSGRINLYTVLPVLIVRKDHCGYSSVMSCCPNPNDPDLALFERDDVDVMGHSEAMTMAKCAEEDPDLVAEAMETVFIDEYARAVSRIHNAVSRGLSGPDGYRKPVTQLVNVGGVEKLFLGLVERPQFDFSDLKEIHEVAGWFEFVGISHSDYRVAERRLLTDISECWERVAAANLGDVFWKRFPDKDRAEIISADEIIEAMCLEGAKEAYDAGVPLEDIIC